MSDQVRDQKRQLRKSLRAVREVMGPEARGGMDARIAERVCEHPAFVQADTVFTYLSVGAEVDTRAIIRAAWQAGKTVAVPRVVPGTRTMEWYRIESFDGMEVTSMGVEEPQPDPSCLVEVPGPGSNAACVALVPGFSFDEFGYRLGYGGGFYDTFLPRFGGPSLGLCRAAQWSVDPLPHDEFDRTVDWIVTDGQAIAAKPEPVAKKESDMEKLMDGTCTQFADALAAKVSVPGGGGAAAYVGALSVALCSMVGNFTTGKKKYAEYEKDVQRMLAEGEAVRARLVELVDEDAAAFFPLSKAYGIPKEDPTRAETLEACTKDALAGPLEMMRQIARAVELLEEMNVKGSRMLISDVGCGAALAASAMQAAAMNVFINTKSLMDREYAAQVEAECDELLAYVPRAQAVADQVMSGIRQ